MYLTQKVRFASNFQENALYKTNNGVQFDCKKTGKKMWVFGQFAWIFQD